MSNPNSKLATAELCRKTITLEKAGQAVVRYSVCF